MTALDQASFLCAELAKRHVSYQLAIVRADSLMVSVAIPGERWEIEFYDDGRVELERFVSEGVDEVRDASSQVLTYFDE